MAYPDEWIPIHLTEDEMEFCRDRGRKRQNLANSEGYKPHGDAKEEWHISGYLGEMAMAKFLDIPVPEDWTWAGDKRRGYDVGGYQCRTRAGIRDPLLIRTTDKEGYYALLLTHQRPVIWLVGWITHTRAQRVWQDDFFPGKAKQPCYSVAQSWLNPFANFGSKYCIRGEDYAQAA